MAHVERTSSIGFGMVDKSIIRDPSLPQNVKTVYTLLATYAHDERSAFPSKETIARESSLSKRAVDAAVAIGAEVGLFTIVRRVRKDDNGRPILSKDGKPLQTSNKYLLHDFGGGYIPGSGPKGGDKTADPLQEMQGDPVQEMHPPGAGAAPEEDHLKKTILKKTTFRSQPASATRDEPSAEEDMDWLDDDNPNLVDDICEHVENEVGFSYRTAATVDSMLCRGETPLYALNSALKQAREEDEEINRIYALTKNGRP